MAVLSSVIGRGTLAARPAAGNAGRLYFATDGSGTMYRDNGSSWDSVETSASGMTNPMTSQGDIIYGGASGAPTRLAIGTAGQVLKVNAGATAPEWGSASGGGSSDPITDIFGAADTAYEFTTTSLTGLTALGTAASEDANTTFPGNYHVRPSGASSLTGRYASVSPAFTAICKITDTALRASFQHVGMYCGEATPGKMVAILLRHDGTSVSMVLFTFTGPTDGSPGSITEDINAVTEAYPFYPVYLGIRAASSTDVSYYWSRNGVVWFQMKNAHDNSMTVGSVGLVTAVYGGSPAATGVYDYLRIWNSAKTFRALTA